MPQEPAASDEGVIVPTEVYVQNTEDTSNSTLQADSPEEFRKRLPHAFEALAASTTVRLGLSHNEEQLFETLINTTEAYERGEITLDDDEDSIPGDSSTSRNQKKDGPPQPLEIRVAGGWVRDKILNLPAHDVDVTLDNLMGQSFAKLIQKYLLSLPLSHPARCQVKYPKIGVIAANPAASKHLETATMQVHGFDIDICHLRSEEIYHEHSRIPTVQLGTPFQDSMRRDFTVNAL